MSHHLAVFNVAKTAYDVDDPRMAEFMENLDKINGLGRESPGFLWLHATEDGNSTSVRIFDDPDMLLNLSVWESVEAIKAYTYKSDHTDFLRRRREWFKPLDGWPVIALWWVPEGHIPSLEEAKERLTLLRDNGPTEQAFTFRTTFDPPAG